MSSGATPHSSTAVGLVILECASTMWLPWDRVEDVRMCCVSSKEECAYSDTPPCKVHRVYIRAAHREG